MKEGVHHAVVTAGLLLDLVGASLLGVEAVKLENIRRLSAAVDEKAERLLGTLNPRIEFAGEAPSPGDPVKYVSGRWVCAWLLGMLALGLLLLVPVYLLAVSAGFPPADALLTSIQLGVRIPLLAAVIAVVALLLSTWFVGWVVPALTRGFTASAALLDAHTPTGGVGLVGVVMLMFGFSVQIVAVWI